MKTKILSLMTAGLMFVSATVQPNPGRETSSEGSGKLLADWIGVHLQLIRATPGLNQGIVATQFLASSLAFYQAIEGLDPAYLSLAGQLQGLEPLMPGNARDISWEAGANTAMATVLRGFFQNHIQRIDSMEHSIRSHLLGQGYAKEDIRRGEAFGKNMAIHVLSWLQQGAPGKDPQAYAPPKGDGLWEPTPPAFQAAAAPYMHLSRSCVKNSIENTLPAPPIKFSMDKGSEFYSMVNDVYTTSKNLTEEQRAIALFWDDYPDHRYYGGSGHWASILRQVILERKLPLLKGAEAFAAMNIAMNDAFIGCFKGKYTYNLLRPVTYIKKYIDPTWEPLIVTPSHPEYPAAHATISMSAATALTSVLGDLAFTDHSYADAGFPPRSFDSFEDAAREAGMSRLYGGIHYMPSTHVGFALGKKIAGNVLKGLVFQKNGGAGIN